MDAMLQFQNNTPAVYNIKTDRFDVLVIADRECYVVYVVNKITVLAW
jgi:hypothetical protein